MSVKLFNKFNECCSFHGSNLANENQNDDCDTGDDKHSSLYFATLTTFLRVLLLLLFLFVFVSFCFVFCIVVKYSSEKRVFNI